MFNMFRKNTRVQPTLVAPIVARVVAEEESEEPNTSNSLSAWQMSINQALDNFLQVTNDLNKDLPKASVLISYMPGERVNNTAYSLAGYLGQVGVPYILSPLLNETELAAQLTHHTHAIILCTKDYARRVEVNPKIRQTLEVFGTKSKNALQPLLCEGGFSDTALKIVAKHYLIRDYQSVLTGERVDSFLRFLEVVMNVSGYQGLGLFPDILGLSEDGHRAAKEAYQEHYAQLELSAHKASIDYHLTVAVERSMSTHPLREYFTTAPTIKGVQGFEVFLEEALSPDIQTSLLFCPNKADTGLTSYGLLQALHKRKKRVLSIDCKDYPGKAAAHCVHLALQKAKLRPIHRQILQKEPIVIVLNGYEDVGVYDNLYVKNKLSTWSNVKLIVTCRSDFFKSRGYVSCFIENTSDRKKIESLSVHKIDRFASIEAQKAALSWAAKTTEHHVEEVHQLNPRQQALRDELQVFLRQVKQKWAELGYRIERKNLFISYAWESKEALVRQQGHLLHLSQDLSVLGFSPWLDIEKMSGDIDQQMAGNIGNSHSALVILTARYIKRCSENTNVKKEFDALLKKLREDDAFRVLPLQFEDTPHHAGLTNSTYFKHVDEHYVDCLSHPTDGLLPKLLFDTPQKQAIYQDLYQEFQTRLQVLVGKHLVVNQCLDDIRSYDIDNQLKGYVKPYGLNFESDSLDKRFDLQVSFEQFLENSKVKTLLVMARAGSGKSCFALSIFRNMLLPWQAYQLNSEHRPKWLIVYISLKNYAQSPENCAEHALRERFQLSDEDIEDLKQGLHHEQHLLFIFDGYDELGSGVRPNLTQSLRDWPLAKLLITSRPEHFDKNHQAVTTLSLYFSPDLIVSGSVKIIYVSPFSKGDIREYIAYYERGKTTNKDIYATLESLPGMMSLLDNPFLLTLVLQALPQLLKNRLSDTAVTRSDIYQAFTETWFLQETNGRELTLTECDAFSQELAFRFFKEKTLSVVPNSTDSPELWAFFNDERNQAMQDASPLRLSGGAYSFIHKSLYEYFVAQYFWIALVKPDGLAIWQTRFLTEERPVLDFLAERLYVSSQRADIEETLLQMVLVSRNNPEMAKVSSSAITLLNQVDFGFYKRVPNQDLSDIHIPYADLTGSRLMGVDCSRMNAANTIFYDAVLVGAKLCDATLTDARFLVGDEFVLSQSISGMILHPTYPGTVIYGYGGAIIVVRLADGFIERTLRGHRGNVRCFAINQDGILASGSSDNTIFLWDLSLPDKEAHLKTLVGHTDAVLVLAFNQEGILASGSRDGTIRLWDSQLSDGNEHLKTLVVQRQITTLAFSQDGFLVSPGKDDDTILIWDPKLSDENAHIKTLKIHKSSSIHALAFNQDGMLVSAGGYGPITFWDIGLPAENALIKTLKGSKGVYCLAFSQEGLLASGDWDNTICLWDPKLPSETACIKTLEGHTDPIRALAFDQNGRIISMSSDDSIRVWNLTKPVVKIQRNIFEKDMDKIAHIAFNQDGILASASKDGTIRLWNPKLPASKACINILREQYITRLAFSQDGLLVSAGSDKFSFWDITLPAESARVKALPTKSGIITPFVISQDGILVVREDDFRVAFWDLKLPEKKPLFKTSEKHKITSFAVSQDGILASGGSDETICFWNLKLSLEEALIKTLKLNAKFETLAFSSSGILAAGGSDETIRLWNPRLPDAEMHIKTLEVKDGRRYSHAIGSLVFSQDGLWMISGNIREAYLWDARDWDMPPKRLPFGGNYFCLQGSLLSFSHDKAVYTVDLTDFQSKPQWLMATSSSSFWLAQCNVTGAKGVSLSVRNLFKREGAIGEAEEFVAKHHDVELISQAKNPQGFFTESGQKITASGAITIDARQEQSVTIPDSGCRCS